METIKPTDKNKLAWAELAESALSSAISWEKLGEAERGARFIACAKYFLSMATLPEGFSIHASEFNKLQEIYNDWLEFHGITWQSALILTEPKVTA
jgi:hypothetical protein